VKVDIPAVIDSPYIPDDKYNDTFASIVILLLIDSPMIPVELKVKLLSVLEVKVKF